MRTAMRSMIVLAATAGAAGCGGTRPVPPAPPGPPSPAGQPAGVQTHTRQGYTLEVTNKDGALPRETLDQMIECFFAVYPVMSTRFNASARRTVSLVIDPDRAGVAGTSSGVITVSGTWMRTRPHDI